MPPVSITNKMGLYGPEEVAAAVHIADGLWVRLDDYAFDFAGIGPRYARVVEGDMDGKAVSFAYLDFGIATYALITQDMNPKVLGTSNEVLGADGIYLWLNDQVEIWGRRLNWQQRVLATAYARDTGLTIGDQVAARRVMNWALTYEERAYWTRHNRQQLFTLGPAPDWESMGM